MKRYWKAILTKENIERNDKMKCACSVKEHGREPIFKNPVSVYVLELTISAYMLLVETTDDVFAEQCFFTSAEKRREIASFPWELQLILEKSTYGKNLRRILSILTRLSERIDVCNSCYATGY